MATLYDKLGVPRHATQADVRKAFRELALRHHPDRTGPTSSSHLFAEASAAYDILSCPEARSRYDAHLIDGREPRNYRKPEVKLTWIEDKAWRFTKWGAENR